MDIKSLSQAYTVHTHLTLPSAGTMSLFLTGIYESLKGCDLNEGDPTILSSLPAACSLEATPLDDGFSWAA